MGNTPKDYDPDSLLARSKATSGIRARKYSRVAREIAEQGKWPGFRPEDKRIIKEATESRRAKK